MSFALTKDQFLDELARHSFPEVFIDIETAPQTPEEVRRFFVEDEVALPAAPGEFAPRDVKCGHLTDPAKIRDKVNAARVAHRQRQKQWTDDCERLKKEAWEKFYDRAPLDAKIGCVCAVGYGIYVEEEKQLGTYLDILPVERDMLQTFHTISLKVLESGGVFLGFNCRYFDLPFLARRSWISSVGTLIDTTTKFSGFSFRIIDLLDVWSLANKHDTTNLDNLARVLGVVGKAHLSSGKDFAPMLTTDRGKAEEYLRRDVEIVYECAMRMGVLR